MKFDLNDDIDKKRALTYFDKLLKNKNKIEIKKFQEKRSNLQNRYFHVCATILSDYSGYTVDEIKIIIKDRVEFMTYTKGNHKFYRSSADLDKMDFITLVDYTRNFAEGHGCYVPTPEEYYESQFSVERELKI